MSEKKVIFIFAAAFLLGLTGLAETAVLACSPSAEVVLYNAEGRIIFRFAPPDGRFTVRFLHSWARSPVDETFQVDAQNNIVLKETVYEDFGAGLPHEPESPMASMTVENGKIYVRDIDRVVPDLQIRTGRFVAAHTLIYGDKRVPFSDFSAPGSAVIFKTQRRGPRTR